MTTVDRVQAEVLAELIQKQGDIDSCSAKRVTIDVWLEDGRVTSIESSVKTVRHLTGKRAH